MSVTNISLLVQMEMSFLQPPQQRHTEDHQHYAHRKLLARAADDGCHGNDMVGVKCMFQTE